MPREPVKLDRCVVAESNVSMMPAEIVVVVRVVVPEQFAGLGVIVLKPVELPVRILLVADSEYLHAPTGNSAVQLDRVTLWHPVVL